MKPTDINKKDTGDWVSIDQTDTGDWVCSAKDPA